MTARNGVLELGCSGMFITTPPLICKCTLLEITELQDSGEKFLKSLFIMVVFTSLIKFERVGQNNRTLQGLALSIAYRLVARFQHLAKEPDFWLLYAIVVSFTQKPFKLILPSRPHAGKIRPQHRELRAYSLRRVCRFFDVPQS